MAPDYIYCDPEIKDALVAELRRQISRQYGKEPLKNRDYGKIINEKHFDRINSLIDPDPRITLSASRSWFGYPWTRIAVCSTVVSVGTACSVGCIRIKR